MCLLGSVLIYIPRNIHFIDALFFASGSCTQSGLNTVDVNLLRTYQQIIIFLLPQLTNPITINTFVVFLRLYWFEKRFQHIAKEAKRQRKTISRTRSDMRGERDLGREERGVRGRTITVMHNTAVNAGRAPNESVPRIGGKDFAHGESESKEKQGNGHFNGNEKGRTNSAQDDDFAITFEREDSLATKPTLKTHATIKFSDQVKRSDGLDDETLRMPARRDNETHIAFLERQRKRDDGVLRIPGPRDADRGVAPERIEEDVATSPLQKRKPHLVGDGAGGLMMDPLDSDPNAPKESKKEKVSESAHAAAGALDLLGFLRPRHESVPDDGAGTTETDATGQDAGGPKKRTMSFATIKRHFTRDKEPMDPMPYISFQPTVGRNSAFVDLTEAQREELGGIEYRSLKSLAMVLIAYFWFFTFFSYISLTPWIERSGTYGEVVDAAGQNRTWWAFFTGTSAFNDVGFTLTPDSMISFNTAVWPLLLCSFLILFGNTAFPIMLRWVIYMFSKLVPRRSGIWEELRFLLDHPRRCFTLLFPSQATWWLFWILALLNGVDLLFFIILDFKNPIVTDLKPNIRVLDGWFQATATRTAGFAVVNLAELHPAVQISYMVMMYISVFPIAISVRRTNVYEEQSLGIWAEGGEEGDDQNTSYVGSHIRRQLSFDLWFVALAWFIIAIAEGSAIQDPTRPAFNLFSILFEIISAYGTVGLSMGYPDSNASFSAQYGVIGKLVIIALQIRGRHRGLPYELDRAILLPSESLHQRELQEATKRRRNSMATTVMSGADLTHITSQSSTQSRRSGSSNGNGNGNDVYDEKGDGSSSGAQTSYGAAAGKRREKSTGNFLSSMLHPGPPAVRRYSTVRKNTDESSLEQRFRDAEFGRRPTFNGDEEFGGSSTVGGRWGGAGGGGFNRRRGSGLDAGGPMGQGTPGTAPEGDIIGVRRSRTSIPVPVSRRVSRQARGTDELGEEDDEVDELSPTSTWTVGRKGLHKVMSI